MSTYTSQITMNTATQSSPDAALSASVLSLRNSLSLLDSSISILSSGIADFPRLKGVLNSTRHFELTPSSMLTLAQQSLASELAPAITKLLQRADAYVAKLERKQLNLIARSELLEGRLEGGYEGLRKKKSSERVVGKAAGDADANERALRWKALRQKKERLGYAVERLGLQSQQRQRQLRMSVAAT